MSQEVKRQETWTVNVAVGNAKVEQHPVLFLHYEHTLDASITDESVIEDAVYVVSLFTRDPDDEASVCGILMQHIPDDWDNVFAGICQSIAMNPMPAVFGEQYADWTLEQVRDRINAFAQPLLDNPIEQPEPESDTPENP